MYQTEEALHAARSQLKKAQEEQQEATYEVESLRLEFDRIVGDRQAVAVKNESLSAELDVQKLALQQETVALRTAKLQNAKLNHALISTQEELRKANKDSAPSLSSSSSALRLATRAPTHTESPLEEVETVENDATAAPSSDVEETVQSKTTNEDHEELKRQLVLAMTELEQAKAERDEARNERDVLNEQQQQQQQQPPVPPAGQVVTEALPPENNDLAAVAHKEFVLKIDALEEENRRLRHELSDYKTKVRGVPFCSIPDVVSPSTHTHSEIVVVVDWGLQVQIGESQIIQLSRLLSAQR